MFNNIIDIHSHLQNDFFAVGNLRIKLFLCLIKHHAMKAYGGVQV